MGRLTSTVLAISVICVPLQRITLTCGRGERENADESGISTSQNGYIFS